MSRRSLALAIGAMLLPIAVVIWDQLTERAERAERMRESEAAIRRAAELAGDGR